MKSIHYRKQLILIIGLQYLFIGCSFKHPNNSSQTQYTHVTNLIPPQVFKLKSPQALNASKPICLSFNHHLVNADHFAHYAKGDDEYTTDVAFQAIDNKGNLWFHYFILKETKIAQSYNSSIQEIGIGCFKTNDTIDIYTDIEQKNNYLTHFMYIDSKNNLWIGSNCGLLNFNGEQFCKYSISQGLPDSSINTMTEDKQGNLWFATNKGVSCYNGRQFINYKEEQGFPSSIMAGIGQDSQGNIWVGTVDSGAYSMKNEIITHYTTAQGLISNSFRSDGVIPSIILQSKKEGLWFRTYLGGVCKFDGTKFISYDTTELRMQIASIFEDSSGIIWFGSEGFITSFNGQTFQSFKLPDDDVALSITEKQKGTLLIGTEKNGILEFDGKSFINYFTKQKLNN